MVSAREQSDEWGARNCIAESGVVRTKGELVAYSRWLCVTMGDATDADKAPVPRETDVHSVLEVAPVSMIARFEGVRPNVVRYN